MPAQKDIFSPLQWKDGILLLLDQLQLPSKERWLPCQTYQDVAAAITSMQVRGAPAIGCAAAYAFALAARNFANNHPAANSADFLDTMQTAKQTLAATRPTAINLFWALDAMAAVLEQSLPHHGIANTSAALEEKAIAIHHDDVERCLRIGKYGQKFIPNGGTVLTHCNAGALATGGYGTALGVLRAARSEGKGFSVLAGETRPYLQGARLTAWELLRDGFDVRLIPDSASAFLMAQGKIHCAIVGADRIAANGDVANKIGTYAIALAAKRHNIPFYVAAPTSTIDWSIEKGSQIPIEERGGDELVSINGHRIAPNNADALYPAFDVTPAELITRIITDKGTVAASSQGLATLSS